MTYTASCVSVETACWMVRKWKVPRGWLNVYTGEILDAKAIRMRSIRNSDYTEALIWGAASEQEAIEMARKRESWA